MGSEERVARPERLHFVRRVAWLWAGGALAAVAAVAIWGVATQPSPNRWIALGLALTLAAVAARVLLRGSSYLDGTVLVQRGLVRTRRADIARATRVRLRPNRAGSVQLVVGDDGGRSAFESLLTVDRYVAFGQPPELLDRIGEALATAPDSRAAGVRKVLRMQAEHLRRGGRPEDSPLRPLTSLSLLRSAEAAGLISILGQLD